MHQPPTPWTESVAYFVAQVELKKLPRLDGIDGFSGTQFHMSKAFLEQQQFFLPFDVLRDGLYQNCLVREASLFFLLPTPNKQQLEFPCLHARHGLLPSTLEITTSAMFNGFYHPQIECRVF